MKVNLIFGATCCKNVEETALFFVLCDEFCCGTCAAGQYFYKGRCIRGSEGNKCFSKFQIYQPAAGTDYEGKAAELDRCL